MPSQDSRASVAAAALRSKQPVEEAAPVEVDEIEESLDELGKAVEEVQTAQQALELLVEDNPDAVFSVKTLATIQGAVKSCIRASGDLNKTLRELRKSLK